MTDREWLVPWVGLPYAPGGRGRDGLDCLGLFLAVFEARRGVRLPDPGGTMLLPCAQHAARGAMVTHPNVRPVAGEVAEGDALLFRMGPDRLHIGYALDAMDMLHLPDSGTGSTIERWRGMRWGGRLIGMWRYE